MASEKEVYIPLSVDAKDALKTMGDVRKALKQIQNEMVGLEEGGDAFLQAAKDAGELKHQLDEIQQSTRGASSDFGDMIGNITKGAAGMIGAFQTAQAALNLFGIESEEVTKSIKTMQNMMAMTQGLASIDSGIKAFKKLSAAITGTTTAAKALKTALQPKWLIAITAAVTAAVYAYNQLTKSSKEAAKAREEARQAAIQEAQTYRTNIVNSLKEVLTTYEKLRQTWNKLKTDAEKNNWVKNNKAELDKLGLSIKSVNDAENTFKKNSASIIKAFSLRAQAAAYSAKATEAYAKMIEIEETLKSKITKEGDIKYGGSHSADSGEEYMGADGQWHYTKQGAHNRNIQIVKNSGWEQINKDAQNYVSKSISLEQQAANLIGGGSTSAATATVTEQEKDAIQEEINLRYARLELKKAENEEYAKSKKALEDYLAIQNDELAHLKDLQEQNKATEQDVVKMETAIAKTNNAIENFGKVEDNRTDFEKTIEDIEKGLAQVDYEFAKSKQEKDDEITKLEKIIDLEQQRLLAMQLAGQEGTAAWYDQLASLEEYKKALQNLKTTQTDWKENVQNSVQVVNAAFTSVGSILSELANNQDQTNREGFENAKKLQKGAAIINMLAGIATALSGAFTTKTGPWDIALAAIQASTIAATAGIQIANIDKQKFDSSSTSGSLASISQSAIAYQAPVQYSKDVQGASISDAIKDTKVYVTETDISNVQHRVSVQESENTY